MDAKRYSKMLGLLGGLAGAAAFVVFGFMQGVLVGGAAGLELGGYILGPAGMSAEAMSRVMTGIGMVAGIILSATMFISSGFAAGRLIGYAVRGGQAVKRSHGITGTSDKGIVHF
ncbi:MAG: hypothetical protein HZC51_06800 [Nitrospirae bacterium]|nr:hypothetical protein [Nitrospirota bacterium]